MTRLNIFYRKFRHYLWLFRMEAWAAQGREQSTGEPLCVCYAGSGPFRDHFLGRAFASGWSEIYLGRHWFWQIPKKVKRRFPNCSLLIFEVPAIREKYFRLKAHLKNPVWLAMGLDLSGSLEASMRKSRFKSMTKRIAQNNLQFEVRRDEAAFKEFYQEMYAPYAQKRFGDGVIIHPYPMLKAHYDKGELVFIKKDGVRIGASLVVYEGGSARLLVMGVKGGPEDYSKMGVTDAIYYFSFVRIIEKGLSGPVHLGYVRAFAKDGTLLFKRSMGGLILRERLHPHGHLYWKILKTTPGLIGFLKNNPIITDHLNEHWITLFADSDAARDNLAGVLKEFYDTGMNLRIYAPQLKPISALADDLRKSFKTVQIRALKDLGIPPLTPPIEVELIPSQKVQTTFTN